MMVRRDSLEALAISIIIVFVFAIVLSASGFWYLIFIPSAVAGILVTRLRLALLSSIASPIGSLLAMIPDFGYRMGQASLFSSVAGFPGGPALPIALLILLSYAFAILGMSVTSSFSGTVEKPKNA